MIKSLECVETCDVVASIRRDLENAKQRLERAEAEVASALRLLRPACSEENLLGVIRNLQQAYLSERDSANSLEKECAELRKCLSFERCSSCGQLYSVDPESGLGCLLVDHIEAHAAISGKGRCCAEL